MIKYNSGVKVEVGDVFMITGKCMGSDKCSYRYKRYVVSSMSKSGLSVYYEDNRTNIKCRCTRCVYSAAMVRMRARLHGYQGIDECMRLLCIGVKDIVVVESRVQRERSIKIKVLGIK